MLYYNADKRNIQLTIVGLSMTEQLRPRRTANVKHKALAHRPFVVVQLNITVKRLMFGNLAYNE